MDTAARLTKIWSRALRLPHVAPDDNFFDLGGDSLTAVGLFLDIEREFDRRLPITTIYDAPTIASLAELINTDASPDYCHFVPLKGGDERTPLFLVHGIGGSVMELAALGKTLDCAQAVYGIQARGLDGCDAPLDRVEAMAVLYADLIRRKQPKGPYFLGGYSFGGVVALEVARRLGSENVAQLIMIDAFAHPRTWPLKCRIQTGFRKFLKELHHTAKRRAGATLALYARNLRALLKTRTPQEKAADRALYIHNRLGAMDPNLPLPLRQTRVAGDAALIAFVPYYYPGKATFIRATQSGAVFPCNAHAVWQPLVAELELITTDGSHLSIIGAHVGELASHISPRLTPAVEPVRQSPAAIYRVREVQAA